MSENTDRSLSDAPSEVAEDRTLSTTAPAGDTAPAPTARPSLRDLLSGATKVRRAVKICPDGGLVYEVDQIRAALAVALAQSDEAKVEELHARYNDVVVRANTASLTFVIEGRSPEWVTSKRTAVFKRFGIPHDVDRARAWVTATDATHPQFDRAMLTILLDQLVEATDADGNQLDVSDLDVDLLLGLRACVPIEVDKLIQGQTLANGTDVEEALDVDF